MKLTRQDTKELAAAVKKAQGHLEQALSALSPLLVTITEAERKRVMRVRTGISAEGRQLAQAVKDQPKLAHAVEFELEAVQEDFDNVDLVAPLQVLVERFAQQLSDSELVWTAEAVQPLLQAYGVAQTLAKTDGQIEALAGRFAALFALGRRQKPPAAK
jgi:vacuolar-type H+-ATPase subunit H